MTTDTAYENKLITLLKQRSTEAFSTLYDKYAPPLYTVVLQIVREEEKANELMKNIFLKIIDTIDDYDPVKENFFIWMFKIARNAALDVIKSGTSQQALRHTPITGKITEEVANLEIDNYGLKKVMAKLKEEHKILVDLCYYRGFTHAEIAKALDIPLDSVQPKLRVAFLALRTVL